MKKEELAEILYLGESRRIEFKSNCENLDLIGQTICGFLNSAGGYLICGIGDMGQLLGVENPINLKKNIENVLQIHISPRSLVSVQMQEVEGKSLLVIEVPAGKDIPYAFRDSIYLRIGQRTQKADIDTIRDMVLRKQAEPERWERRFSSADIELDIDMDEIRFSVVNIRRVRPSFFRDTEDPYAILEDLSAAKYGRLTNGGDVLFGQNPAKRLPQVRVRAAYFSSDKGGNTFRDMKSFEGPLVPVLEKTFDFIARNTPTIATFPRNKLQRLDEFLYPPEAIREGLINAFAHRDYADSSGGVTVNIYPKRLEIWNSGSLPEGITPETLVRGHLSVLRNPDIAHVLYLRGFMEMIGRGSVLILTKCKERGLAEPVWTSDENTGVTLTFFAQGVTTEVAPEVTGEVGLQIAPEVLQMLEAFRGDMTRRDLQQSLGLRDDEHFRKAYLLPAIRQNLIEMTRPDRPRSSKQKYRLTQKGRFVLETNR
ncbi:MAG TPA: putative DNA binding domain-containing protein [Methanothrix sp.]|nr:putative DNA binding domain-containing protein [Methanothrix sp.]